MLSNLSRNRLVALAMDLQLSESAAVYLPSFVTELAKVGGISENEAIWQLRHNEALQVECVATIARCIAGQEVTS